MVSRIGREQVGLQPSAWAGPSARDEGYRRPDPAHGAGQSLLGLHPNQGSAGQSGTWVGRGTIANILKEHGIELEPAPERDKHTSWSSFLKAHWDCLSATDFLTVEVS